jgi:hypothetical protein
MIVRTINDAGIIVPPLFERYPTIIGLGDPYRIITDYQMTKGTGTTDTIPTTTSVNEIVSIGDLPGVARYVAGTDYNLVGDTVSWIGGGTNPTNGNQYFITYTEARAVSAYDPILYFDENLIYADHGFQVMTNGVVNDVSVGGFVGLNAGAKGIIIAQLDPTGFVDQENPTNTELEAAFIAMRTKLNLITGYKLFLCAMSSGTLNTTTAANIFFNHAVLASQPARKQERTVLAALAQGTAYTAFATFAQSYAHERMVVPATPGGACQVAGVTGTFDTRFYCAALAGMLCSGEIGVGISDEIVPNITLTGTFSPEELEYLVQRGASPGNQSGGVTRNVMAITTDTTSALTEDLGVQDEKDYIKKYWRESLYPVFRNKKITTNLILTMIDASEGILNDLVDREIIAEYRSVNVAQSSTEPRLVNVSARIKPAFSLQWMDVEFTFVLSF